MGRFHSLLFRMLYPVPQKGEDLLTYKQKFIEEYILSNQLGADFALFFIAKQYIIKAIIEIRKYLIISQ